MTKLADIEERNAIIRSAKMHVDDHGCLTVWLDLDYGGSGQGFGGYALYLPASYSHHTDALKHNFAGHFIWRCMEVAGVTDWGRMVGQTVRARCEHIKVHAIGHIVKDDWFNPSDDFERMQGGDA